MERFIAARDELLFGAGSPPAASGRLVPYQVGMPCLHWEAVIETPGGEEQVLRVIRGQGSGRPRGGRRAAPRARR